MIWFVLGLVVGAAVCAIAGWWVVRAQVRRARHAERIAQRAERLAEAGAMTSGLAHEIRNPLSTIGLNAQLLDEAIADLDTETEERDRMRRRLGSLRREVDRLGGILEDFLQFAGVVHLERCEADLNEVAGEMIDFFYPQAEQQGVRLRAELQSGSLIGVFDVSQIKQAALNLMLNAVQAMAGDATTAHELIIRTCRRSDDRLGSILELHVIDTGPGMDEATRDRVLQPYFTTKTGGTGLGLPTARRIVEAHGGRLDLHTEPGRGTDFTIVLPEHPVDIDPAGQTPAIGT